MLSVYICEDNPVQLSHYEKIINNFILIEEFDMKIQAAVTSPDKLLITARQHQAEEPIGGFYLLDIALNTEMNGFALAQEIRSFDSRAFIVFITTHSEMALLTFQYQIEAMDFIIKDESWKISSRLRSCLESAINRYQLSPQAAMITFKSGTNIIHVEQNNILYIEALPASHRIQVVMNNGVREFYGTLNSCAKVLGENFIRCHRAVIVNINHVAQVDRKNYILTFYNGQTCIASTRGISLVTDALQADNQIKNPMRKLRSTEAEPAGTDRGKPKIER